ncbi:hypothetical protein Syun_020249 [Stephania yunnanensis]|uniref:Serine/threonine-protein kinase RIO1 n=1 Tax=Stephania yunnanensis TaxID=152371 RepID=A0AAP0NMZ6_9MAGN
MTLVEQKPEEQILRRDDEDEDEEEEDELSDCSESEIGEVLDWLDSKDDEDAVDGAFSMSSRRPNAHGGLHSRPLSSSLQPISNRNQKFTNHIRAAPLEEWEGRMNIGMSNSVTTVIRDSIRGMSIGKTKNNEKADRATVEQAIDPRTRMVLFKMLNRGVFNDINGCISTGKEANVYHATKSDGQELAIKIYKTSILVFKDRDRYVHGDYRFRHGYCKHNPRKMVKTWAEKEMRNLLRLKAAGIRCPTPLLLRLHVLVMEFIGKAGWAAPRLKDAALSQDKLREDDNDNADIISKVQTGTWRSERGHLYIIDVSQSVDLDHPHALDFLREDCLHVSDFFKKHGIAVMTVRELFDFIVDPTITGENVDSYLEEVQRKIEARGDLSTEDEIADSVFVQNTGTCEECRRGHQRITSGEDTGDMYYQTITGLKHVLPQSATVQENEGQKQVERPNEEQTQAEPTSIVNSVESGAKSGSDDDEDDEEDSEGEESENDSADENKEPIDRKTARKENKKKVKEEKREARKNKVPKSVKKRKKKLAKAHKCSYERSSDLLSFVDYVVPKA